MLSRLGLAQKWFPIISSSPWPSISCLLDLLPLSVFPPLLLSTIFGSLYMALYSGFVVSYTSTEYPDFAFWISIASIGVLYWVLWCCGVINLPYESQRRGIGVRRSHTKLASYSAEMGLQHRTQFQFVRSRKHYRKRTSAACESIDTSENNFISCGIHEVYVNPRICFWIAQVR